MAEPPFIVAEISKTWTGGGDDATLISQDLEKVIAVNLARGYLLYSFSHSQMMVPQRQGRGGIGELAASHHQQETIIAVFRHAPMLSVLSPACEHVYESNPGLYDTQLRFCKYCGMLEP